MKYKVCALLQRRGVGGALDLAWQSLWYSGPGPIPWQPTDPLQPWNIFENFPTLHNGQCPGRYSFSEVLQRRHPLLEQIYVLSTYVFSMISEFEGFIEGYMIFLGNVEIVNNWT